MTDPRPWMTPAEIDLLERNLRPWMRVFEFGSGSSTEWLARRVRHVTSVEHNPFFAARAVLNAPSNASVLYVPPDMPYSEGGADDGDWSSFRSYIEAYQGRGIDVVLVDGRARLEALRFVAERAPFGPTPDMLVFVHDVNRIELEPAWRDRDDMCACSHEPVLHAGGESHATCIVVGCDCAAYVAVNYRAPFELLDRVDNLAMLAPRFGGEYVPASRRDPVAVHLGSVRASYKWDHPGIPENDAEDEPQKSAADALTEST